MKKYWSELKTEFTIFLRQHYLVQVQWVYSQPLTTSTPKNSIANLNEKEKIIQEIYFLN